MNRSIRTYQDLLQEEQMLQRQLESCKTLIKKDVGELKHILNPIYQIKETAKKFFTRDNNGPFYNIGLNFGVDLLIRRLLFARAGRLVKIIVPFLVKNYASHFVKGEDKEKMLKNIARFFKKFSFKRKQHDPTTAL